MGLLISHPPHNMEIEIPGDEVTGGKIDNAAIICI
jgi:hypothetical protein